MAQTLTPEALENENRVFAGTTGVSDNSRPCGFLPGFKDEETGELYVSKRADGSVALVHMLEGLPDYLILARTRNGRVIAVKTSVIAGFIRDGQFYTREQAVQAVS